LKNSRDRHHLIARHALVYWGVQLDSRKAFMNTVEFSDQLEIRIAKYNLLRHPFYKAWSAGELTRNDLREYAQEYYHYVRAIPSSLAALALRLRKANSPSGPGRNVRRKRCGGRLGRQSVPHAELWLDFAEGMGSSRNLEWHIPGREIRQLIRYFYQLPVKVRPKRPCCFYAYESQVPRVAQEREQGLREIYRADHKTCGYFTLHANPDFGHARFFYQQIEKQVAANPNAAERVLDAAENAQVCFGKRGWHSSTKGLSRQRSQPIRADGRRSGETKLINLRALSFSSRSLPAFRQNPRFADY